MLKKTMRFLMITTGVIALTACSTTKHHTDFSEGAGSGDQMQSYGLGNQRHFTDEELEHYGFRNGKPTNQTYYFDYDSNVIKNDDADNIAAQAQYLREHPSAHVLLEGNTDERGSREYNIALGERRALAVVDMLKSDGVGSQQIRWVSYGKEKPVALGHSESAYSKNRRVNLVYESL